MPIEIKELHIKATVSREADRGAPETGDDLLLFGDAAPFAQPAIDDTAELVLFGETGSTAAKPSHHSNGVNALLCDGSVRFVADGLDLFG